MELDDLEKTTTLDGQPLPFHVNIRYGTKAPRVTFELSKPHLYCELLLFGNVAIKASNMEFFDDIFQYNTAMKGIF